MSTAAPVQEHAIIKTSEGEMTLAFWPDVAPKTVENFKKLARDGFYNGTAFHRIIKGFRSKAAARTPRPAPPGCRAPAIRATS